jgi:hypothetical protein
MYKKKTVGSKITKDFDTLEIEIFEEILIFGKGKIQHNYYSMGLID